MCAWNVEYGPLACLCVMRACAEDVDFLNYLCMNRVDFTWQSVFW
jgi:hypothetical protein